jgi:S-adenosylmethionine-dependent methyltransferase
MISIGRLPKGLRYFLKMRATPAPPRVVTREFRDVGKSALGAIEASLRHTFFADNVAYLSSHEGRNDLQDHLRGRLNHFRRTVIPWLNDARPLSGAKILEIGCGTGSSTVALAEQGAKVTAIDILGSSLHVARERCRVYGLEAEFLELDATEVQRVFHDRHFDFIIFFGVLEHMTHDERMIAMRETWSMLSPSDLWVVVDTPNRLWFHDGHTSMLPFFHWLPDDLAFKYSRFSPRESLKHRYHELDEAAILDFLRLGRGVSFHEFELTMDRAESLPVLDSLSMFLRKRSLLRAVLWKLTSESRYESFLARIEPRMHRGFFHQYLDLIIRKD